MLNLLIAYCISEINNTQIDDTHDIDAVMPILKLGKFCQYYTDEPASGNKDFC